MDNTKVGLSTTNYQSNAQQNAIKVDQTNISS